MRAFWNHSGRRTKADSAYHSFQRRPLDIFLFRSNFAFRVFVSSASRQVESQSKFHSYAQRIPSLLIVPIPTGLVMRLVLMVVCTSGVGAFNPFFLCRDPRVLITHRNKPFVIPGTLNAYSGWKGAGFANPGTTAWTPLRLQLPAPTRAIR